MMDRCTCTPDTWSEPGSICSYCEQQSEDFEADMPFDFDEWLEWQRDGERPSTAFTFG